MKRFLTVSLLLFIGFSVVKADTVVFTGPIADEKGISYSKNYDTKCDTYGIDRLSVQAYYSTATFSASSFNDGLKSTGSITIASNANVTGRRILIGSYTLTEGVDWTKGNTASDTAKALAININAHNYLKTLIKVEWRGGSSGVITSTAIAIGTAGNLKISASSPTAITCLGMTGGTNATMDYTNDYINTTSNYPTGIPVLYRKLTGTTPIGLVTGTTYYTVAVDTYKVRLTTTSAKAQSGLYINFAQAAVASTGGGTYTLSQLANTGTAYLVWQVSNDGTNWNNLNTSSATITTPGSSMWDLGYISFKYVRAKFTAASRAAYRLLITGYGKRSN
jgi:hypothetical protein